MSGLQGFEKSNIQSSLSSDMTEKFQWKELINPSPDEERVEKKKWNISEKLNNCSSVHYQRATNKFLFFQWFSEV